MYDGFISYSHAADDLLAPRLQAGLQRFAKPWWQRRALRIFRDESSLSANPHLWSSITEALDESEWFVLLLSPDAAQSEWVNQEVAYWVAHKDPDRIIPVVTAGEFGWDGDVTGTAAPEALVGVLSEEPRWVDARGLGDPESLDLKNPEFAAAVADLAAPLRGVPKDELASEEVRQHKRTVRTAWAAGVVVVVLAVVASMAAAFAVSQREEALRLAQAESEARDLADREAENARLAEEAALVDAANSAARRLAAESTLTLADDPQLAMLLALEGVSIAASEDVATDLTRVLRDAVTANRLLARFAVPSGPVDWPRPFEEDPQAQPFGAGSFANRGALSPDGRTIYHLSRVTNALQAMLVEDRALQWEYRPDQGLELHSVVASPDGGVVAASLIAEEERPGRVVVLGAASGAVLDEIVSDGCPLIVPVGGGFSVDGRWFSVYTGDERCVGPDRPPEGDWAAVYDTSTWTEELRHLEPDAKAERLFLAPASGQALKSWQGQGSGPEAELVTFPGLEPITGVSAELPFPGLAPSGDVVVSVVDEFSLQGDASVPIDTRGLRLWREESGFGTPVDPGWAFERVKGYNTRARFDLDRLIEPLSFSPDGTLVALATRGADENSSGERDAVLDAVTGRLVLALGETSDTFDMSWSADGSLLLSVHEDQLLLWEVVPDTSRLNPVRASQDWVRFALESALVRGFSPADCAEYDIEPCPTTLEEVRERYGGLDP